MLKKKNARVRGKIKLSEYFNDFEKGDRVAVKRELAVQPKFPKRLQGRSGVVEGKRGNFYIVKIKDIGKEKSYVIHPVHLRRLR